MPTIDIVTLDDDPHETEHGIREDTVSRGVDLDGAKITATYADGSIEILAWTAYDPYTYGGATGADIEMSYGSSWHELSTTKLLTSLKIDLQPANSVFDITFDNDDDPLGDSTLSSKVGYPFQVSPDYDMMPGDIVVTYSGIVNLTGSPAVGDLFTTMIVDFSDLPSGGLLGDLDWSTDIDTMEVADDLVPTGLACFTRGTLITTDRGDVPVETLTSADKVLTQDNGLQQLRFALSRIVGPEELGNNKKLYPIRIMAGAMGSGLPSKDLLVSRQHRMVAKSSIVKRMFGSASVLVAAIRLTELPGIQIENNVARVEYFHLIFDRHEVVFAEGTPTESFLVNGNSSEMLSPAQREEIATLFPDAQNLGCCKAPARSIPARNIPSHLLQKQLIYRHVKNEKDLLGA